MRTTIRGHAFTPVIKSPGLENFIEWNMLWIPNSPKMIILSIPLLGCPTCFPRRVNTSQFKYLKYVRKRFPWAESWANQNMSWAVTHPWTMWSLLIRFSRFNLIRQPSDKDFSFSYVNKRLLLLEWPHMLGFGLFFLYFSFSLSFSLSLSLSLKFSVKILYTKPFFPEVEHQCGEWGIHLMRSHPVMVACLCQ